MNLFKFEGSRLKNMDSGRILLAKLNTWAF